MARKKDIERLISGIVGNGPAPRDTTERTTGAPPVTPEMEGRLEAARRANAGRPPKGSTGRQAGRERRATFIVDKGLVRKMKYISLVEGRLLKDVVGEGLASYVEGWEARNGAINLPETGGK